MLTAQSNGVRKVEDAADRLAGLIGRKCAGECRIEVLDRRRPKAEI
jgi:hypothetical protein